MFKQALRRKQLRERHSSADLSYWLSSANCWERGSVPAARLPPDTLFMARAAAITVVQSTRAWADCGRGCGPVLAAEGRDSSEVLAG